MQQIWWLILTTYLFFYVSFSMALSFTTFLFHVGFLRGISIQEYTKGIEKKNVFKARTAHHKILFTPLQTSWSLIIRLERDYQCNTSKMSCLHHFVYIIGLSIAFAYGMFNFFIQLVDNASTWKWICVYVNEMECTFITNISILYF